jgi:hypothetical protein
LISIIKALYLSLKAGPSTFLASHYSTPIGGLILHSPLSSGARLIDPNLKKTLKNDIFPNIDYIK